MKRGLILILFLLIIPFVSAEIVIDGPQNDVYNLGDSISVSGYVLSPETTLALFFLSLNCESELQLLARTISLETNEKKLFLEPLAIPPVTGKDCTIKATLNINGEEVETEESRIFSITKDLDGIFDLEKKAVQLGENIAIKGTVTRLNGRITNGLATIFLKQDGTNFFVDTSPIINSELDYTYISKSNPAGIYDIDIQVNDVYGNKFLFENVLDLEIIDKILVTADVSRLNVRPSDKIKVLGRAETLLKKDIEVGNVRLELDGEPFQTRLDENNAYEYEIELKEDIETGDHTIKVIVEDSLGNNGETEVTFTVLARATEIKNTLNKAEFLPKETLTISSQLYDQAHKSIEDTVSIEIKDPEGKEVFKRVVQTGEEISYNLPQSALPGTWKVKTFISGLKTEDNFLVKEVTKVGVIIENDIITITNIGNVDYKKPIEIKLKGTRDSTIIKKPSLKPEKSTIVYLADEIPSGTYNIEITYDDKKDFYKNVAVADGKAPKTQLFFGLLIILIIIILIYIIIKMTNKKNRIRKSLLNEGKKRARELKKLKEEKPSRTGFGWRNIIGSKEERIKKAKKEAKKDKKEKGGGLFSMFD